MKITISGPPKSGKSWMAMIIEQALAKASLTTVIDTNLKGEVWNERYDQFLDGVPTKDVVSLIASHGTIEIVERNEPRNKEDTVQEIRILLVRAGEAMGTLEHLFERLEENDS